MYNMYIDIIYKYSYTYDTTYKPNTDGITIAQKPRHVASGSSWGEELCATSSRAQASHSSSSVTSDEKGKVQGWLVVSLPSGKLT